MNDADLIQAAVRNETARHDATARAFGLEPERTQVVWRCLSPAAVVHPGLPRARTPSVPKCPICSERESGCA